MTTPEPQPDVSPPSPRFQFDLRTLLFLFVVLGSSLAVFGVWGILVFLLAVGLAISVREAEPLLLWPSLALVVIVLLGLAALLLPLGKVDRENRNRRDCANNLCGIDGGLRLYCGHHGGLPPAYIADKNGKPMHSWRVLVDVLDQDAYDYAEPWDGPKNKKARTVANFCYHCDDAPHPFALETSYLAVVGPNAAWPGEKPRKLGDFDFVKEAANTIMVVEVYDSGIEWSEPRDLSLDDPRLSALLKTVHPGGRYDDLFFTYYYPPGIHVLMADGNVRVLKTDGLSNEDLRKILQVGGCKEGVIGSRVLFDDSECRVNLPNIAALAVWLLSVSTLLTHAIRSRKVLSVPPS